MHMDSLLELKSRLGDYHGRNKYDMWGQVVQNINNKAKQLPTPSHCTSTELKEKDVARTGRFHQHQLPNVFRIPCLLTLARALDARIPKRPIKKLHYDFVMRLREYHKTEEAKVMSVFEFLKTLFDTEELETREDQNSGTRIDTYVMIKILGLYLLILEYNGESNSSSKSEGYAQAVAYYLRQLSKCPECIVGPAPCLLLTVQGTILSLRSVMVSDCEEPNMATETVISTIDLASDYCFQEVANLLEGLVDCVGELLEYHKMCIRSASEPTPMEPLKYLQYRFPSIPLQIVTDIVYTGDVHNWRVFDANGTVNGRRMNLVVKLLQGSYDGHMHRRLSGEGLAPMLVEVVDLHYHDWQVIVMERVELLRNIRLTLEHKHAEESAVAALHEMGFVHGDLRSFNRGFVAGAHGKPDRFFFIDFDWSGVAGTARYPYDLNLAAGWEPGVLPNELITPEHDLWQVQQRYQHLLPPPPPDGDASAAASTPQKRKVGDA